METMRGGEAPKCLNYQVVHLGAPGCKRAFWWPETKFLSHERSKA